jgi:hypothetical protein
VSGPTLRRLALDVAALLVLVALYALVVTRGDVGGWWP